MSNILLATQIVSGIVSGILNSALAAQEYQLIISTARAEDREITDDELAELRADNQELTESVLAKLE